MKIEKRKDIPEPVKQQQELHRSLRPHTPPGSGCGGHNYRFYIALHDIAQMYSLHCIALHCWNCILYCIERYCTTIDFILHNCVIYCIAKTAYIYRIARYCTTEHTALHKAQTMVWLCTNVSDHFKGILSGKQEESGHQPSALHIAWTLSQWPGC